MENLVGQAISLADLFEPSVTGALETKSEWESVNVTDIVEGGALQDSNPSNSCRLRRRHRAISAADKERKRLNRLLRNRVSAQQARDRHKKYVHDLENIVIDLQRKNSEMEKTILTLQCDNYTLQTENSMLRQILVNAR